MLNVFVYLALVKISSSVSIGIFIVHMMLGLDLGLTSHPNDMASLFSLIDIQDPHPHWLRKKHPDSGFDPRTFGMVGTLTTVEPRRKLFGGGYRNV